MYSCRGSTFGAVSRSDRRILSHFSSCFLRLLELEKGVAQCAHLYLYMSVGEPRVFETTKRRFCANLRLDARVHSLVPAEIAGTGKDVATEWTIVHPFLGCQALSLLLRLL